MIHFQTDPAVIELVGPEDHVAAVKQIQTKPVDIIGVSRSLKKEISLDLPVNTAPKGSADPEVFTIKISNVAADYAR